MSLLENDRVQEWLIIINDSLSTLKKGFVYALLAVVILAVPVFFLLKFSFYKLFSDYTPPAVNRPIADILPLQVLEKKALKLDGNSYSAFVRIKNLNLDWGVPEQHYTAVIKTLGGSEVTRVSGKTFILPASEKLIVFNRFTSDAEAETIVEFSLSESKFLLKPQMSPVTLEVSRTEIRPSSSELVVSSVVKNTSAFSISQVNLPVILFNRSNQVVGVNFTSINDLKSLESRSFQVFWPKSIPDVIRAEVTPEINIYDKTLFSIEPGKNPYDTFINEDNK